MILKWKVDQGIRHRYLLAVFKEKTHRCKALRSEEIHPVLSSRAQLSSSIRTFREVTGNVIIAHHLRLS